MIRDDSQQNKNPQSDSETDKEVVFLDGKNVINVINASKTRDEDVFKLLVGFSATLISGFILRRWE